MTSELAGLSSLPPSSDAKPMLDGMRLLEDTSTNNLADMAFSFEDLSTGLSLMFMNDHSLRSLYVAAAAGGT